MAGRPLNISILLAIVLAITFVSLLAEGFEQPQEQMDLANISQGDSLVSRMALHGKRQRRLFRLENWVKSLKQDMKTVYETYGMPSTRYRQEAMGEVIEKWTYLDKGLEFTFKDNKIIRQRKIGPSSY